MRNRVQEIKRSSGRLAILVLGILAAAGPASAQNNYYFAHLALGGAAATGGWQTTITYINYSPSSVTCTTNFFTDSGAPLAVPFAGGAANSVRTDIIAGGGSVHLESTAALVDPTLTGWAKASCTGPVKASLLFRDYRAGVPEAESGVNAMTDLKTTFVTFAEPQTGVAYANPSTQSATVTFTVFNESGAQLGTKNDTLAPNEHKANNVGPFLGLSNFKGSLKITSTVGITSLALNFEASQPNKLVFSSLPPGDIDAAGPYYFTHLALGGFVDTPLASGGGAWQSTLTYINSSTQSVTCTTSFYTTSGAALAVSFGGGGAVSSRIDTLAAGGSLHVESTASTNAQTVTGWAQAACSGTIKASLLFRLYLTGNAPVAEAGLNGTSTVTNKFVSFGEKQTGFAIANLTFLPVGITITAFDTAGKVAGTTGMFLLPRQQRSDNLAPLLGLSSFTGSVQITSSLPFVALSLNFEATTPSNFIFSALPPGELDSATPLATGN
ncbi:MAG: hypothetical protein A3H94_08060 [Acidobacteria bacterium RIFCSPLOWO2_02_FULL_60_20]|nr:MAG: hypothetical protein A3H94_08060 [Acidobacteria bacterium RIFCSPLOWO2_02_FULL_60_20]